MMQFSRELAPFIAPFINSYKRYASLSWAPVNVVWGRDNRTTGFRLVGHGPALHVENRFPGGDMNAYLTYAAADRGGPLRHRARDSSCTPEFKGNGYIATGVQRMPRALWEAIQALEKSEAAVEIFGQDVVDHYLNAARRRTGAVRLDRPRLGPRAVPRTRLTPPTRVADKEPRRHDGAPSVNQKASAARRRLRPRLRRDAPRGHTSAREAHRGTLELRNVVDWTVRITSKGIAARGWTQAHAAVRAAGQPPGRSVPLKTCQASSDLATRLITMYVFSPTR